MRVENKAPIRRGHKLLKLTKGNKNFEQNRQDNEESI